VARDLLLRIQKDIVDSRGSAKWTEFSGLRAVDAKVREAKMVLADLESSGIQKLVDEMGADGDFEANSRRVRLEALSHYVKSALRLLSSGAMEPKKRQITRAPDVSSITSSIPGLKGIIDSRWLEAQKCQHVGAHLSAVTMMGSILEGLLLARANMDATTAYRSPKAPKGKDGKVPAVQDWNLNALIDVAVDVGWIKSDRGKFSHALRESRNVVHPWVQISQRASFDPSTCRTCWEVFESLGQRSHRLSQVKHSLNLSISPPIHSKTLFQPPLRQQKAAKSLQTGNNRNQKTRNEPIPA
jgi:hypothetical protein